MPVHISDIEVAKFDWSIKLAIWRQSHDPLTRIEGVLDRSQAFVADIAAPEKRRTPEYVERKRDGCLVISFNASWFPFLVDSMGKNDTDHRCYVPGNSVLDHVVNAMRKQHRAIAGGRAFLHANGAMGANDLELVKWALAVPSEFLLPRINSTSLVTSY